MNDRNRKRHDFSMLLLVSAAVQAILTMPGCGATEYVDYDNYEYGDENIQYNHPVGKELRHPAPYQDSGIVTQSVTDRKRVRRLALPLCCPRGKVFDHLKCIHPPPSFDWRPTLNGASGALLEFNGFPKCAMRRDYIQTYQKEVHFNIEEAEVFLPYHVKLLPIPRDNYCIAKVYDPADVGCKEFQTKVFTCYSGDQEPQGVLWTSVAISHGFLFVSLVSFFVIAELRCLQGQYMICFLISLLIYDLCLFPGSYFPMEISDISCIALGAVKYFFFCGIFLWFNTICFDIWRTARAKQDICGRRRFLSYSAYSWILGAILTTVVLVLPYVKDNSSAPSRNDPLKDGNYDACKLKLPMNMILQIAQVFSLVLDLAFLTFASLSLCSYPKFGNGLARSDISLCLKQGWKLFFIMIAHTISGIDPDIMQFPVPFWLYVLLESTAVFAVFTYRRTIMRKFLSQNSCTAPCTTLREPGSAQEKGHLTLQ